MLPERAEPEAFRADLRHLHPCAPETEHQDDELISHLRPACSRADATEPGQAGRNEGREVLQGRVDGIRHGTFRGFKVEPVGAAGQWPHSVLFGGARPAVDREAQDSRGIRTRHEQSEAKENHA